MFKIHPEVIEVIREYLEEFEEHIDISEEVKENIYKFYELNATNSTIYFSGEENDIN